MSKSISPREALGAVRIFTEKCSFIFRQETRPNFESYLMIMTFGTQDIQIFLSEEEYRLLKEVFL